MLRWACRDRYRTLRKIVTNISCGWRLQPTILHAHNMSTTTGSLNRSRVATDIWVSDSLSQGEKVRLTLNEAGNLKWYTCGPTVYDVAHLGHARNYVTVDILQRILTQYFGIEVIHVMGLTDIDDKILRRARERELKPRELATHYEREFFEDLYRLRVCAPTAVTRVTEHIPHIIACVVSALRAGFAYRVSSGNVYFDTARFEEHYRTLPQPLRRESATDETEADADIDPDLLTPFRAEKRDRRDFALWKASTTTDSSALALSRVPLSFPLPLLNDSTSAASSPVPSSVAAKELAEELFVRGRPGWHIECVAMSSAVFGNRFDVHSGGIDLLFPHHHNEYLIAHAIHPVGQQQEPWVRYFLHVGHLHIQGRKMSKSLKNFITIRDFLARYTANEFRLFCLQTRYQSPIDYSEIRMAEAAQILTRFNDFFVDIADHIISFMQHHSDSLPLLWQESESLLLKRFESAQQSVHMALCDNFDTPMVLRALFDLMHEVRFYLKTQGRQASVLLLTRIAHYVYRLLTMFGLEITLPPSLSLLSPLAYRLASDQSFSSAATTTKMEPTTILRSLIKFREEVRKNILNRDGQEWSVVQQQILKLTDQLREELVTWGIQLEDKGQITHVRARTQDITDASQQQLEEMRQKSRARQAELARLAAIPPKEYLRDDSKYSAYDELGIPTHKITGEPLSSSQRKKLEERYYKHKRAYDRHCNALAAQSSSSSSTSPTPSSSSSSTP
jgi:cysteinyl-tRNA synthetase